MRAVPTRLLTAEADTGAHASEAGGKAAPVPDLLGLFTRVV